MIGKVLDFLVHLSLFLFLICVMIALTYIPFGSYVNTAIVLYALWNLFHIKTEMD